MKPTMDHPITVRAVPKYRVNCLLRSGLTEKGAADYSDACVIYDALDHCNRVLNSNHLVGKPKMFRRYVDEATGTTVRDWEEVKR